jgi:hypothetical protein
MCVAQSGGSGVGGGGGERTAHCGVVVAGVGGQMWMVTCEGIIHESSSTRHTILAVRAAALRPLPLRFVHSQVNKWITSTG